MTASVLMYGLLGTLFWIGLSVVLVGGLVLCGHVMDRRRARRRRRAPVVLDEQCVAVQARPRTGMVAASPQRQPDVLALMREGELPDRAVELVSLRELDQRRRPIAIGERRRRPRR